MIPLYRGFYYRTLFPIVTVQSQPVVFSKLALNSYPKSYASLMQPVTVILYIFCPHHNQVHILLLLHKSFAHIPILPLIPLQL